MSRPKAVSPATITTGVSARSAGETAPPKRRSPPRNVGPAFAFVLSLFLTKFVIIDGYAPLAGALSRGALSNLPTNLKNDLSDPQPLLDLLSTWLDYDFPHDRFVLQSLWAAVVAYGCMAFACFFLDCLLLALASGSIPAGGGPAGEKIFRQSPSLLSRWKAQGRKGTFSLKQFLEALGVSLRNLFFVSPVFFALLWKWGGWKGRLYKEHYVLRGAAPASGVEGGAWELRPFLPPDLNLAEVFSLQSFDAVVPLFRFLGVQLVYLVVHALVVDAWFYWTHRLLHEKPFYKSIHKVGHCWPALCISAVFCLHSSGCGWVNAHGLHGPAGHEKRGSVLLMAPQSPGGPPAALSLYTPAAALSELEPVHFCTLTPVDLL